jgi:hypothetical protein
MGTFQDITQTIKAITTAEHAPSLPLFPPISVSELLPGDTLLFYGYPGVAVTQRLGVNKYGYKFHPAYHAALMMRDGIFHDVGQFTTDHLIADEFKSTRRIDVIRYQMTQEQRTIIFQESELDTTIPHTGINITSYGIADFLHFGFSSIGRGKTPVCSANVVQLHTKANNICSVHPALDTAPWDLQEYATLTPSTQQFTLWNGQDYHP